MDVFHQIEITLILLIQSIGGWLAGPMQVISFLGREEFFMAAMPLIYWSIDGAMGLRFAVMLLFSNAVNCALKLVFHSPRPYWIDARVRALSTESSFGLPSNHAQVGASVWGLAASVVKPAWARVILIVIIGLIGFSRIYLGMHFISDVIFGWIIGALLLFLIFAWEAPVLRWLKPQPLNRQVIWAFLSSLILIGIITLSRASAGSWQIPQAWIDNVSAATPGSPIAPFNLDDAFTLAGTWFGMMAGVAWLYHRQGTFNAAGTFEKRALRYIVGIAGMLTLYLALGAIFPRQQDILSFSLRYIRYTFIGLWVAALAPMVFSRIGLVDPGQAVGKKPLSPSENPL